MKLQTDENQIKSSQSMTCLLTSSCGGSEELARFCIDRPYNSAKKKRFTERGDSWQKSLEGNRSISTCSLQSNATTTCYTGKDYFWGVTLQTSYNFIMDTDLMESCSAVQQNSEKNKYVREIVPVVKSEKNPDKIKVKEGLSVNSRTLKNWLIDMEERIWKIPSLKQSMKIKPDELQKCLREHSELYKEIIGHGSIVRASIRPNSSRNQHETAYLQGLERKYHLLYLKAIEVKLILEGLSEQNSSLKNESTDDEPEPKTIRLGEFKNDCKFSEMDYEADSECSDWEINDRPLAPLSPPILKDCDYDGLSMLSESTTSINFIDNSRFNRSNRKSKNCATFYFKHEESDKDLESTSSSEGISYLNDEEIYEKISTKESIKKLILGAESLICDKIPKERAEFLVSSPESERKFNQKNKRVEEWLQSQPTYYESSLGISEGLGDSIETSGSEVENHSRVQNSASDIQSLAQFSVSESALDSGYYDRSALIKVELFPDKSIEDEIEDLISNCSEQEWDDYQDDKYLPEHYSEEIDSEAVMKLLNFGENYGNYLDSQSDFSSSSLSDFEEEIIPTPECSILNLTLPVFEENATKSESSSSSSFTTRSTKKMTDHEIIDHSLRPKDFDDIIATCRENPRCLRAVLQDPPGTILSPHTCQEISFRECRCAKITRFIARILHFLMDVTNVIKNWRLYRFLAFTMKTFYKIAETTSLGILLCTRYLT